MSDARERSEFLYPGGMRKDLQDAFLAGAAWRSFQDGKLYGLAFIEARKLMAPDAYAMFVEAMDKARAELANQEGEAK